MPLSVFNKVKPPICIDGSHQQAGSVQFHPLRTFSCLNHPVCQFVEMGTRVTRYKIDDQCKVILEFVSPNANA